MSPAKPLRPPEQAAWTLFFSACPLFAGEPIVNTSPGPDPPDVLCDTATGRKVGVELRAWLEASTVQSGADKDRLQEGTLRLVGSETQPRPHHIGMVRLKIGSRVAKQDHAAFREQLFGLIEAENAKPPRPLKLDPLLPIPAGYWNTVRSWDTGQAGAITDLAAYPALAKYLDEVFILPRSWTPMIDGYPDTIGAGTPWVVAELVGGAYDHETMIQAAVDSITAKVTMYAGRDLRMAHSLGEFDLLCHFIDQTDRYNPPLTTAEFGFEDVAQEVRGRLAGISPVFDKIFILYPHEEPRVLQVYP